MRIGFFIGVATRPDAHPHPSPARRGAQEPAPLLVGKDLICYTDLRSTISFLISPIALAGFRPFGQVFVQFMIVWQR